MKLVNISDKMSSLSFHMFLLQRLYLSNCQNFMVGHFKIMHTQGKNECFDFSVGIRIRIVYW